MHKTIFSIEKMDCPSEEQLVRMKLAEMQAIASLSFDLQKRILEVIHADGYEDIRKKLDELNLNTALVSTGDVAVLPISDGTSDETTLLRQVLLINLAFFVIELVGGWLADSMGLVADSLDMLADSIVYGLSLYAVGRSTGHKKRVARTSGYFQLVLALLGFVEVARRFLRLEELPSYEAMILISVFALAGNALSLYLLQKSKSQEAHMQASMIFTSNDVIVNIGVILAGFLVLMTDSRIPDLVIGVIIFAVVGRGAFRILRLST
ncbi:MAG TPA: cation transporter [Bacteroidota bacterium]|nr:cation transporter [Bacteroidota bacterium]